MGCALNLCPADPQQEIKNLRRKLKAGADFILTQPIYEAAPARAFVDRYISEHGPLTAPLIAGVLPLVNHRHAAFLHNEVPGVDIPDRVHKRLEAAGENAMRTGRELAVELIEEIRPFAQGIYLMPAFNRFDNIAEIIDVIRR